jgi:hypothetical protein
LQPKRTLGGVETDLLLLLKFKLGFALCLSRACLGKPLCFIQKILNTKAGWFLRREEEDVLWAERQLEEAEASGGKKTRLCFRAMFTYIKNDHFAKTGSGQT